MIDLINYIDEYVTETAQLLKYVRHINGRLEDLKVLLNKCIICTCREKELSYTDSLICNDQLSKLITTDHVLNKLGIFYNYYDSDNKIISYNYFELSSGRFEITLRDNNKISPNYLKRDLKSIEYILKCINELINTLD